MPVHDTVTLTEAVKEIDTVIQYAPVFFNKKAQSPANKATPSIKEIQENQSFIAQNIASRRDTPVQFVSDIYTLTTEDLDKALQKRNGKNRQDDMLSKQFGFVSTL